MTDDVKAVAQKILDRAADQIGTHSIGCYEYHLPCFAAFVMRQLEATSAPVVDREALVEWFRWHADPNEVADNFLASGILRDVRDVQAETLEQAAYAMEAAPGPLEKYRKAVFEEARWLRARAQAIREARNER